MSNSLLTNLPSVGATNLILPFGLLDAAIIGVIEYDTIGKIPEPIKMVIRDATFSYRRKLVTAILTFDAKLAEDVLQFFTEVAREQLVAFLCFTINGVLDNIDKEQQFVVAPRQPLENYNWTWVETKSTFYGTLKEGF